MQLQRISSALLYMAGCPDPYYISLSRVATSGLVATKARGGQRSRQVFGDPYTLDLFVVEFDCEEVNEILLSSTTSPISLISQCVVIDVFHTSSSVSQTSWHVPYLQDIPSSS